MAARKYQLVKFLTFDRALLRHAGLFYVASFADVAYSGPEVLVFPGTQKGDISSWLEVDGGRGYRNLQEFISEAVLGSPNVPEEDP